MECHDIYWDLPPQSRRSGTAASAETKSVQLAREMSADVDKAAALFTGQVASGAAGTRDGIGTGFDAALASIATVFDELVARGCDRIKVPTDHRDINKQKLFFEVTAPWSRRVEGVRPVCGGHDSAHRPMKN